MPKVLRLPSEEDLPRGPRREFVKQLFVYYRIARRPDLRKITDAVNALDENIKLGTASRETIRQMLNGQTVPRQWQTAAVVFMALCELADVDYDAPREEDDIPGKPPTSRLDEFEKLWNLALDTERPVSEQQQRRANMRMANAGIAKMIRTRQNPR